MMSGGRLLIGDCRESLRRLPDESVNCIVTSPPYFGLRDYGTGEWEGGEDGCDHTVSTSKQGATGQRADRRHTQQVVAKSLCERCGARRVDRQLGLEETPDEFIASLVEVFREARRVLRDDGTLWDNTVARANGWSDGRSMRNAPNLVRHAGLKPKDLVGIPWMLAFALRADGWFLRQDITWSKKNTMPESVRDRCTKAHEYIFMLSKSKSYYFDAEAIKEPLAPASIVRLQQNIVEQTGTTRANGGRKPNGNFKAVGDSKSGMRNKRSVWHVSTQPFKQAHFATYPPALIEPCILAGCPEGGTVLDPFFGAGTTGLVAQQNGRRWIGCELNPDYAEIARWRLDPPIPFHPIAHFALAV